MGFVARNDVSRGTVFDPGLLSEHGVSLEDQSTDSDAAFKLAQWWLGQCRNAHPMCHSFQGVLRLPDRVIDVGPANGSQEPRLRETRGVERRHYLTLSHCWGATRALTTETATLAQRLQGIPISTMPRTFADAVRITRRFGVRYLWIDALCIIQDDKSDWEIQAAEMASIYRNALFTISAANKGGCFAKRDGYLLRPHQIDPPIFGSDSHLKNFVRAYVQHVPKSEKLSKRAWILQEQVLSSRTLIFDVDQIHWRCCSCIASERHPGMRSVINYDYLSQFQQSLFDGPSWGREGDAWAEVLATPSQSSLRTVWHDMVEMYTSRALTKQTDRLAAIHGLADAMSQATGRTYLAGLWREHLQLDLAWARPKPSLVQVRSPSHTTDHSPAEAGADALAPSWSWASLNSRIVFPTHGNEMPVLGGVVLDARVQGSPSQLTGLLTVEGSARIAFVSESGNDIAVEDEDGVRYGPGISWWPDDPNAEAVAPGEMLLFVAILRSYPKNWWVREGRANGAARANCREYTHVYCLALAPATTGRHYHQRPTRQFHRVGLAVWPTKVFEGNSEDIAILDDKHHAGTADSNGDIDADLDSYDDISVRMRLLNTNKQGEKLLHDLRMLWRPRRVKARIT